MSAVNGRKALGAAMTALFIVSGFGRSQVGAGVPPAASDPHAAKIETRTGEERVTLPFRMAGNHVVIPITIEGTRLDVILDTGMPTDGVLLYRNARVARLNLAAEDGMKAHVAGAGSESKHMAADIVTGLTLDIAGLRLTNAKAIVAPPVPGFLSDHDGVIGAALFTRYVVTLDFDARLMTLQNAKAWTPRSDATAVPLTMREGFAFAEIVVMARDGRRTPAKVVVDLGASHAISLNIGETQGIEAPSGAIRTILGRGIGGEVRGQVGRLAGIELGGIVVRDVVATFPDRKHQRPGGMDFEGGNLGSGLLQHFHVSFDYSRNRMYLAPNKAFDRPFEWDMSGLRLEPDGQGGVRVLEISAASPAEAAGIKTGDVLARVDGKTVREQDLHDLKQQLRRDGVKMALMLTRNGKTLERTILLKRLV